MTRESPSARPVLASARVMLLSGKARKARSNAKGALFFVLISPHLWKDESNVSRERARRQQHVTRGGAAVGINRGENFFIAAKIFSRCEARQPSARRHGSGRTPAGLAPPGKSEHDAEIADGEVGECGEYLIEFGVGRDDDLAAKLDAPVRAERRRREAERSALVLRERHRALNVDAPVGEVERERRVERRGRRADRVLRARAGRKQVVVMTFRRAVRPRETPTALISVISLKGSICARADP